MLTPRWASSSASRESALAKGDEGTGANGKKFAKLQTVHNYRGLTEDEHDRAMALTDAPTEEKVEFIFGLMAELRFQTHQTAKELAWAWGLKVNTVRAYCARAGDVFRMMARHERSPEEYRQQIQLRYEHLTNMALQAKKPMLSTNRETGEQTIVYADAPNVQAAITATKAMAELQGAHRNAVVEAQKNQYIEDDESLEDMLKMAQKKLEEEDDDGHQT